MGDKSAKLIRSQLRLVVKENIKETLTNELASELSNALHAALNTRLDKITEEVRTTLQAIDERSKDVQAYIVRQSAPQAPISTPSEGQKAEQSADTGNQ